MQYDLRAYPFQSHCSVLIPMLWQIPVVTQVLSACCWSNLVTLLKPGNSSCGSSSYQLLDANEDFVWISPENQDTLWSIHWAFVWFFFCLSFLCMVPSCFWLVCILWTPIVDLKIKEKYLIRKFGGIGVKEDSVLTVTKIGKARCIKYLKLQVSFWEEAGNVIEPVTVSTMVEGGMEMSIFEYLDWVEGFTTFW